MKPTVYSDYINKTSQKSVFLDLKGYYTLDEHGKIESPNGKKSSFFILISFPPPERKLAYCSCSSFLLFLSSSSS